MKLLDNNGAAIRILIGILIIILSQLAWHFLELPDFVNGLILGIGIGVLTLAIIRR